MSREPVGGVALQNMGWDLKWEKGREKGREKERRFGSRPRDNLIREILRSLRKMRLVRADGCARPRIRSKA